MRIVIFPIMCHFPRGDEKNSLLIEKVTIIQKQKFIKTDL